MKYQLIGWKSKNIPTEDEMPPGPSLNTGASGGIFQHQ
jgi:hypothetical protein